MDELNLKRINNIRFAIQFENVQAAINDLGGLPGVIILTKGVVGAGSYVLNSGQCVLSLGECSEMALKWIAKGASADETVFNLRNSNNQNYGMTIRCGIGNTEISAEPVTPGSSFIMTADHITLKCRAMGNLHFGDGGYTTNIINHVPIKHMVNNPTPNILATPYTYIEAKAADGTIGYIPFYKKEA